MVDQGQGSVQSICHVVATDRHGHVAWANAAFVERAGQPLSALRGRNLTELLQADRWSPAARAAVDAALLAAAPTHGIEIESQADAGPGSACRVDIEPQHDADGAFTGHLWLIADAGGERSRHRRLQMLQRWYLAALEDPRIGFWERNLDTGEASWDDGMRALWDLPPGTPALDLDALRQTILPEHRPVIEAAWAASQHEGAVGHGVYRMRSATGRVRWVQSNWSVLLEPGPMRIACGSVRDITDAVHTRSALELEREQLLLAAEIGRVGMLRQDLASGRMQVNAVARMLFDLPASGPVERAHIDLRIHPDDAERVARAWQSLVAGRDGTGDMRLRVCRDDGSITHLLARLRVLRNSQGRAAEAIGAFIDVTEAARAEDDRLRAQAAEAQRDEAAALAQAQTTVLAAVGHEIRSPLNAMAVAGEQLARCRGPDDSGAWLQLLDEAVLHLRALADDLMRSVTSDQGAPDRHESVDLLGLVDGAVRWLRPMADEAGVSIDVDAASLRALPVHGSRQRLRQVVLNLLGNAIKYNRRGGQVRLHGLAPLEGRAALVVEDNGVGMSDSQRQRLFRPFDRLGREGDEAGGFGFGLYLVQRLVQAMDGRIDVWSRLGHGSRFSVWLPTAAPAAGTGPGSWPAPEPTLDPTPAPTHAPTPASSTSHAPAPAGRIAAVAPAPGFGDPGRLGRLLLVDDDEISPLLLRAQLEDIAPFHLHTAAGTDDLPAGLWAGDDAPGGPLRLALIDLNLGSTTGEAVLARLRRDGYQGPAVAYTGDADPQRERHARAAGFAEVWLKPLRRDELASALARVLADPG